MSKLAEIYARRERTLKRRERRRERVVHEQRVRSLAEYDKQVEEYCRVREAQKQPANSIGAALASKLFG